MIDEERLIASFLDLVRIDSPSGEEEAFAAELTRRLKALGAEVRRDAFGNLIARIGAEGEPFLLGAHMDTVEPGRGIEPRVQDGVIRTDGSTVLGGDPKSGIAAILEGLMASLEAGLRLPALQLVFTRQEESGLVGSANLDYSMLAAKRGVEFDGEGPVSKVTIAAPGRLTCHLEFQGRGAHAGVEPEKGISAIQMAARFISGFPQGRQDDETTANIGLISGGSAVNAVPEAASLDVEARSRDRLKLEAIRERVLDLVEEVRGSFPGGKVEYELKEEFSGYKLSGDHPVVQAVAAALRKAGFEAELAPSGGATDSNNYAGHGMEVIVVGLGGEDFHTVRESIQVDRLMDVGRFCFALIESLSEAER